MDKIKMFFKSEKTAFGCSEYKGDGGLPWAISKKPKGHWVMAPVWRITRRVGFNYPWNGNLVAKIKTSGRRKIEVND